LRTESVCRIIDQIYESVLEPDNWKQFLHLISSAGQNACGSLVVNPCQGDQPARVFEYGEDQSHLRLYFEKLAAMKLTPGGRPHLRTIGDLATLTMLCGDRESLEHDFYIRWVKPSGFRDMIGVLVLKSGKRIAWFSVARTEVQSQYCDQDVTLIESITPHICRALMLADTLEMQSVMRTNLERTMDSLSTGVILTDKRGVTYMNPSAKALIDSGDAIRIKDNKLCVAKTRDGGMLEQALGQSLRGNASPKTGSYAVAIPRADGAGVLANVLPLSWREGPNPFPGMSGAAAVLIQDASQMPQFEGEALARLYALTPAELRITLEIARGQSLQDIAEILGITINTAKTHLKHIFAKTGVTRQGELVRLIMLSSRPIRATTEKGDA